MTIKKLCCLLLLCSTLYAAAAVEGTLVVDATMTRQKVTGFGAFVCSPQFGYNHVSNAEIETLWGTKSTRYATGKSGDIEAGINELSADEIADSPTYNLQGQRVTANTQGLMVKQGRKYFSR